MEEANGFSRFDVILDDSDHYFLTPSPENAFSNANSVLYKHIMREWKTLQQNLPESIYVRVYERRMDLMRAVIVGAAGTPYHDGLFFFDIKLPSDYPAKPPRLCFRSFGLRLNPNLYANGTVCLSLLNTWFGKKSEKWDPSGSTLLQILLSIQGLVLNEKPYFNEPGRGVLSRSVFDKMSRAYNESVFVLTCRCSVYLIRRPPKNFESFVRDHFRERASAILAACGEYANGRVRVGHYGCNGGKASAVRASAEFKKLIGELYDQLVAAFQSCGAVLGDSVQRLELKATRPERGQVNGGMFNKAMRKIKKVFGWNKSGNKKIK